MTQDNPRHKAIVNELEKRIAKESDPNALKLLISKLELLNDSIITYKLYHCRCPELRRGIHLQDCLDTQQRYEDEGWVPAYPPTTEEEIQKMFDEEHAAYYGTKR